MLSVFRSLSLSPCLWIAYRVLLHFASLLVIPAHWALWVANDHIISTSTFDEVHEPSMNVTECSSSNKTISVLNDENIHFIQMVICALSDFTDSVKNSKGIITDKVVDHNDVDEQRHSTFPLTSNMTPIVDQETASISKDAVPSNSFPIESLWNQSLGQRSHPIDLHKEAPSAPPDDIHHFQSLHHIHSGSVPIRPSDLMVCPHSFWCFLKSPIPSFPIFADLHF